MMKWTKDHTHVAGTYLVAFNRYGRWGYKTRILRRGETTKRGEWRSVDPISPPQEGAQEE